MCKILAHCERFHCCSKISWCVFVKASGLGWLARGCPTLCCFTTTTTQLPSLFPAVYSYDGDRSEKDLLKYIAYRRTTEPGPLKPAAGKEGAKEAAKEEL